MKLHKIRFLRRMIVHILERVNPGDVTIHHHWTGDRLTLHSFKHKSYWYYGEKRKQETMKFYSDLIGKGDFVIEIGAHIGYVSQYFAHLIGPEGRLIVFEPDPDAVLVDRGLVEPAGGAHLRRLAAEEGVCPAAGDVEVSLPAEAGAV